MTLLDYFMQGAFHALVVISLHSTLEAIMSRVRTIMRNWVYFIYLFAVTILVLLVIQTKRVEKMKQFSAILSDVSLFNNQTIIEPSVNYKFKLKESLKCEQNPLKFRLDQRGLLQIFHNFIKASKSFACHETVTYTAPADYTFLGNLPILVQRWKGPISVAIYAPGEDFHSTLKSIAYLRKCLSNSHTIRETVTFHLFFHQEHIPKCKNGRTLIDSYTDTLACDDPAPYKGVHLNETYRRRHNLTFPINVARNIARQSAQTHYVFAADIELYPSINFIDNFIDMLDTHPEYVHGKNPRVFVLPIFEIKENVHVPDNKTILQELYKTSEAQLFHKHICSMCHSIPNLTQWINTKESESLDIFITGKRESKHRVWEAFYVGTKEDPLFDERLNWEGQGNKMSQGFAMCLLNYDYLVLNNAFLIHKPGIKTVKEQVKSFKSEVHKSDVMLKKEIKPLLISLYGEHKGCYL